jgi:hypothetical protein
MSFMDRIRAFVNPTAKVREAEDALMAKFNAHRMIWTEKGHRFASELENIPHWTVEPDGKALSFIDTWVDKVTGEVVSQATHSYSQRHLSSEGLVGNVNEPPKAANEAA